MSDVKLGQLTASADRDAVHVAVIPVSAGEWLKPGDRVVHAYDDIVQVPGRVTTGRTKEKVIGVVDPFLVDPVAPGQRFWLFLLPGTVQNLRHNWDTDEFPQPTKDDDDADDYDGCRGC